MLELIIDNVTHWDERFFTSIFRLNGRRLVTRFFQCVSFSGNGHLYPFIAAGALMLSASCGRSFFIAACCAFAIELPLYKLVKNRVRRNRPFRSLKGVYSSIVPSDQFSFPSGHTAAAFIMATLLGCFFPVLTVPAYLWACLVGFSRIYLGVHFPTDILAGMVLGISSAATGIFIAGFPA